MKLAIKTLSPKSHLEVCSLINMYDSTILEARIPAKDFYGFFVLDVDPDTSDSFSLVSEIEMKTIS